LLDLSILYDMRTTETPWKNDDVEGHAITSTATKVTQVPRTPKITLAITSSTRRPSQWLASSPRKSRPHTFCKSTKGKKVGSVTYGAGGAFELLKGNPPRTFVNYQDCAA